MPKANPPDPKILPFASEVARKYLKDWIELGSSYKVAQKYGIHQGHISRARTSAEKHYLAAMRDNGQITEREQEVISVTEEHKLKRRVKALEQEVKELTKDNAEQENLISLLSKSPESKVIPIKMAKGNTKRPKVAATAFLSDCHFDEVVDFKESGGINEYDRFIAERRLEAFAEKTVMVARDLMSGFEVTHLDLPFGGDMVSGNIHEELARSNHAEIMDTVDHWSDKLAQIVVTLSKEFPTVFIPCVVGNHGRNTKKPRHKGRIRDNYDWLIYRRVEKSVLASGIKNVRFGISDSTDVLWETLGHKYLLTHGDQASGGAGWGGIFSPIMRLYEKKLKAYASRGESFDTLMMGHWHQFTDAGPVIVNGCFPAGSVVQTLGGFMDIERIGVGDVVLSRDGTMQHVTHVFERQSSAGLVHHKVRGLPVPLTATPNHLIWAVKGETRVGQVGAKWDKLKGGGDGPQWIPADFISPGDYVHIPRQIGADEPITPDQAWMFGLYLAEGSTLLDGGATKKHNRIALTMHEREIPFLERWAGIFEAAYGHRPKVWLRKRKNYTAEAVVSPGRDVCLRFRQMFGHRATGKCIPTAFFSMKPEICREVVRGWIDGDGHTTKSGVTSATTVSKDLAYGMFRLALSAGMRPSMSMLHSGGARKHNSYTIHFNNGQESIEVGGELFYRVHARYRDAALVPVYDLEVSGEHTYQVGFVGVHNSLKGYDEFAHNLNFRAEPPQQAFWLTDPEKGKIFSGPLFVDDYKRAL